MLMKHHTWLFLYKGTQKCVVAKILPDSIGIYGTLELSKLQEYLPEDVDYLDDGNDQTYKLGERAQKVLDRYKEFILGIDDISYDNIHNRLNTVDLIFLQANHHPRYHQDDLKEILKRYEDN